MCLYTPSQRIKQSGIFQSFVIRDVRNIFLLKHRKRKHIIMEKRSFTLIDKSVQRVALFVFNAAFCIRNACIERKTIKKRRGRNSNFNILECM